MKLARYLLPLGALLFGADLLALPAPAMAQAWPPLRAESGSAANLAEAALPEPAAAPPAPAQLPLAAPGAPAPPTGPPPAPVPGLEQLPQGGWRLRFQGEGQGLSDSAAAILAELGSRLAQRPQGRITLLAHASGPVTDGSAARRLSLARALAVKRALAAGGLAETRIDIRALGRSVEAVDAVDVQPPEAARAADR